MAEVPFNIAKPFPDMDRKRFYSQLIKNINGRVHFIFIDHFSFADQNQAKMCQLHQVAAGSYSAVFINAGSEYFY
jgi:hypothetical protein